MIPVMLGFLKRGPYMTVSAQTFPKDLMHSPSSPHCMHIHPFCNVYYQFNVGIVVVVCASWNLFLIQSALLPVRTSSQSIRGNALAYQMIH